MSGTSVFKERTLAFPFKISQNGLVAVVDDQESIWSNKVKSVVGTTVRERVMRPVFGSRLNELAWNTEGYAKQSVQSFVEQAFLTWLPSLTLNEVTVSDIDDAGQLNISISYLLPNDTASVTTVGIVAVSGNLQPTQEIR